MSFFVALRMLYFFCFGFGFVGVGFWVGFIFSFGGFGSDFFGVVVGGACGDGGGGTVFVGSSSIVMKFRLGVWSLVLV